VDIPKVKLQAHRECKAADWELAIHEEVVGRWWGRWEDVDERGRWVKKVEDRGGSMS